MNKQDRWSALSMKDRATLIDIYVKSGITDLGEIRKDYNSFAPGGPIEVDEYGYPADITPAVVTQDAEFNKFLMTLPDNQRFTPEEDYHTYQYWKINGRPKDFSEALNLEMYHYDSSDNSYHANSVAFDSKGVGHFMKPKHHSTVKYELDWYNKGIGTLEGGEQYPLQGEERKEWEDFRSQYQLDSTGVDYKYVPRKHHNSFDEGGTIEPLYYDDTYIEPAVVKAFSSTKEYNRYQGRKGAEAVRRGMNKAANTISEGLRYTPVVGDVMDGLEAYEEAKTGNLTKAGVLAGLTLLPNALEKPVKAVGKGLKNLRLYNRYVKDVKRFEEPVQFAIKGMEENYDVLKANFPEMNTVEDARRTMNTTVSTRFKPLEAIKNKTLGDYTFDNGEIWLNAYAPIRLKQAWKSPKHSIKQLKQVAVHEGTHSALDNLNITLSEKNGNYYRVIPGSAIENSTKHLYNKVGREGTAWQNLPEEFIAEMNAARYTLGEKPGSSIDSWSTPHANRSENYLSRRFSFEPGETGELIDIYEGFGFDNGGFLHIDPFNLTSPKEDSIIVPYKDVVTSKIRQELIKPSQDKITTFVEKMYPVIEQTLIQKGHSTKNINNILRQMAFESDYGLLPRGNGYNLSGIKTWNESEGSRHSDGNLYRNFKDYSDYANFYIDLLNNRYDAINAKDTDDYIYKLHHGKNGEKYSSNEKGYVNVFNNMKSLDAAIKKYLNK